VITALHRGPIKMPIRKRYPPVRTRIPHSKRPSLRSPPQNQRDIQQHSGNQPVPPNSATPHRRIPKIPKKSSVPPRRLRRRCVIHPRNRAHRFAHWVSGEAVLPRGQPNRSIARVSQQRRRTSNCLRPFSALFFIQRYRCFPPSIS